MARSAFVVLALALGPAAVGGCLLAVSTDGLAGDPSTTGDADVAETAIVDASDGPADATARDADADARAYPEGAVVFPENGHAYLVEIVSTGISWTQARDRAQSLGGHLVTIGSAAENAFVLQTAVAQPACFRANGTGPWLGGRKTEIAGGAPDAGWGWVDGTPWVFVGWRSDQPDDTMGVEDYLDLYRTSDGELGWNDDALDGTEPRITSLIVEFE